MTEPIPYPSYSPRTPTSPIRLIPPYAHIPYPSHSPVRPHPLSVSFPRTPTSPIRLIPPYAHIPYPSHSPVRPTRHSSLTSLWTCGQRRTGLIEERERHLCTNYIRLGGCSTDRSLT